MTKPELFTATVNGVDNVPLLEIGHSFCSRSGKEERSFSSSDDFITECELANLRKAKPAPEGSVVIEGDETKRLHFFLAKSYELLQDGGLDSLFNSELLAFCKRLFPNGLLAQLQPQEATEIVHRCPLDGESVTPCCWKTPFELLRTDRITLDDSLVTCKEKPSSSGVAVGLDNINFGKAIPQTNPETTEVFTTSVKKKPDVATAAWISHKGRENCVATKVEIELTEYDKQNIRTAMGSIPLPVPLAEIIAKLYYAISPRPVKGEK